ncbi:MAG: hypothetical protein IKX25_08680 [Bacteroidales bacterium]|nr:hypothetical protein [Bacteroidales bacterium]
MNKLKTMAALQMCSLALMAQNIDFDLPGKVTPGKDTEINYISWAVPRAHSDTKTFDNGMTITISADGAASDVGSDWSKADVETNGLRVIADEVLATNIVDGNLTQITEGSTSLVLTITGMTPGEHSLKAYHNNSKADQIQPDIEVRVDGNVVATGVKFTSSARSNAEAGTSFITFNVTEGQPVVITYSTAPEEGMTYTNTRMMINGLEFDVASIVATDPQPADHDFHAGTDDGTIHFSWAAAPEAVSHKMVLGTDSTEVANATSYEYEGTAPEYEKIGLKSMQRYWWRVDEVDADGQIHPGKVWACQPRQLAFPGAEGYGRYAIGGRGGVVYHVTSLSGGKEPGTLLYGLVEMNEPRYIVFDVSGTIELDFNSYFTKPYAYIAGQTAPGKGICIKHSNINIGSDIICRHMRFKRGYGDTGNALGMTGADHSIIDHTTAAWGTDETFSSRGAKNITFQYSMIAEALGIADHKNYAAGTNHGFAATIGGERGTFSHNLLVNCAGRNWSMGGGLDGNGNAAGELDMFNNVCYNWWKRTTDGGAKWMQFVNNYYKMGPDTRRTELFIAQNEGGGERTQFAYVDGNIRENKNHSLTHDALNDTYTATGPEPERTWVDEPFFESEATIHTAQDAMKIVTTDAGATMPCRDNQHVRVVKETIDGSYTYVGSRSGIKGEIDHEDDAGGWEDYPVEYRAEDWDTDQDGMPNWYEQCIGSDPETANHNDDPDDDGWTLLEDYLDFVAHPYIVIEPNGTASIDLRPYFIGFYGQNGNPVTPSFSIDGVNLTGLYSTQISGTTLTVSAIKPNTQCVGRFIVVVNDGETTFSLPFGIAITSGTTAIRSLEQETNSTNNSPTYDLLGRRISHPFSGLYIQSGKKIILP